MQFTKRTEMDNIFDIAFEAEGKEYKGWVNPSGTKHENGIPDSFHVVLNDVSLGHLSYNNGHWSINEDRPVAIVAAAGREIEKKFGL
jgi:hypothetical protein